MKYKSNPGDHFVIISRKTAKRELVFFFMVVKNKTVAWLVRDEILKNRKQFPDEIRM